MRPRLFGVQPPTAMESSSPVGAGGRGLPGADREEYLPPTRFRPAPEEGWWSSPLRFNVRMRNLQYAKSVGLFYIMCKPDFTVLDIDSQDVCMCCEPLWMDTGALNQPWARVSRLTASGHVPPQFRASHPDRRTVPVSLQDGAATAPASAGPPRDGCIHALRRCLGIATRNTGEGVSMTTENCTLSSGREGGHGGGQRGARARPRRAHADGGRVRDGPSRPASASGGSRAASSRAISPRRPWSPNKPPGAGAG